MKPCSVCGLEIQDAAIKCRFCKNWLVAPNAISMNQPAPLETTTSGLAIASLVLGITWVYWIGSIVALILGYVALREIRRNPGRIEGKGMAMAGIVLGWVGMAILAGVIGLAVYIWKHPERPPQNNLKVTGLRFPEDDPNPRQRETNENLARTTSPPSTPVCRPLRPL